MTGRPKDSATDDSPEDNSPKDNSPEDNSPKDNSPKDNSPKDNSKDPAMTDTTDLDGLGFAAALDELNSIVVELESDSLDVDLLASRVERAAVLAQWCRSRIDGTRFQVEEILARLDPDRTTDIDADDGGIDAPLDDAAE